MRSLLPTHRIGRWTTTDGVVQQDNYSCGACAAMLVASHFLKGITYEQVVAAVGTTEDGTSQTGLIRGMRELGLRVGPRYDLSDDVIRRSIDASKLIIVYNSPLDHWEVIYGYIHTLGGMIMITDFDAYGLPYFRKWNNAVHGSYGIVCSGRSKSKMLGLNDGQDESGRPDETVRELLGEYTPAKDSSSRSSGRQGVSHLHSRASETGRSRAAVLHAFNGHGPVQAD